MTAPGSSARACGDCTLCCKLLGIDELDKPAGQWCAHCAVGRGCAIYESRPEPCRTFLCGYLTWPVAGEHWFPVRSKMILASAFGGKRLAVHVDPGRPNAWREAPYYSDLKRWSAVGARDGRQLVVSVGRRSILILPDRDVELPGKDV